MALSIRLEIKPGVERSVQLFPNAVIRWVASYNGKSVLVTGKLVDGCFVPNSNFVEFVKNYQPKRASFKEDIHSIADNTYAQRLRNQSARRKELNSSKPKFVTYDGVQRKIYWTGENLGHISYRGKRVYGYVNQAFVFYRKETKCLA